MPLSNVVLDLARTNRSVLDMLLKDVEDERMAAQPAAGMNHPAWIVGHLVYAHAFAASLAGAAYRAPEGWDKLFGTRSIPKDDRSAYPGKAALLAELDKAEMAVLPAAQKLDDELLAAILPNEELRGMLPTVGHGLIFLLTAHYALHAGQLSAWRRAMGLPWAFGA